MHVFSVTVKINQYWWGLIILYFTKFLSLKRLRKFTFLDFLEPVVNEILL